MLVTVVGVAPTVFAEEAEFTIVDEVFGKTYWKEFYEYPYNYSSGRTKIVKDGNWYYAFVKPSAADEFFLYVCGYDGNETEITIPIEFDGENVIRIREFYLFSTTVKTINIPKEIISVNGASETREYYLVDWDDIPTEKQKPFIECAPNSQLEEIVVDNENKYYSSLEGVLFTKNFLRLVYYPVCKAEEKYIIPDTVKYISDGALSDAKNLKSLTITPNVEELGYDCIPKTTIKELRFENVLLPEYVEVNGNIEEKPTVYDVRYVPEVPNATVYCIKDSELYEYYDLYSILSDACKALVSIPPLTETLVKEGGKWYHYCNDYKMNSSTLVKYKGKWFYVTNGVCDKTVTDKVITYKNKSFYIKNGKWDSSVNTLTKKNGEWLGIVNGKWDTSAKTLIKYKGKWFYVKNGEWCKKTAIVKYKGKRFYVKNGKVDFDFSGKKKIDGKTYKIKNGKVA